MIQVHKPFLDGFSCQNSLQAKIKQNCCIRVWIILLQLRYAAKSEYRERLFCVWHLCAVVRIIKLVATLSRWTYWLQNIHANLNSRMFEDDECQKIAQIMVKECNSLILSRLFVICVKCDMLRNDGDDGAMVEWQSNGTKLTNSTTEQFAKSWVMKLIYRIMRPISFKL